jgi:hypothetical protein
MADHNVITDWPAYFAKLGPLPPHTGPTHSDPLPGPPSPFVVFMNDPKSGDLGYEAVASFDEARDVYEANGGPEMWFFWSPGAQPWHCPTRPRVKSKKG